MEHKLSRGIAATAAGAALVSGLCVLPAGAAEPATRGCYGETISALASTLPTPLFGQAVVGFAQDPNTDPGLGDGVQLVQAGVVPDGVVLNTCNNP